MGAHSSRPVSFTKPGPFPEQLKSVSLEVRLRLQTSSKPLGELHYATKAKNHCAKQTFQIESHLLDKAAVCFLWLCWYSTCYGLISLEGLGISLRISDKTVALEAKGSWGSGPHSPAAQGVTGSPACFTYYLPQQRCCKVHMTLGAERPFEIEQDSLHSKVMEDLTKLTGSKGTGPWKYNKIMWHRPLQLALSLASYFTTNNGKRCTKGISTPMSRLLKLWYTLRAHENKFEK